MLSWNRKRSDAEAKHRSCLEKVEEQPNSIAWIKVLARISHPCVAATSFQISQLLPFLMNTDHAFLGHGCDHFPEPIIHVTQSKPTPA